VLANGELAMSARPLLFGEAGVYPQFVERAKGCRFTDTTGRTYVDWVVGWGSALLGFGRQEVDDAISRQLGAATTLTLPSALEVEVADALPAVLADRDRLLQVLLNLLSNAVKFCGRPDGRVKLGARRSGELLRVDVTDNGVGISAEDQALIFEKFRQSGDTLTQKPTGSGLGLAISRQIIEHFGGRLWVVSAPGSGSTFSFTLPARESAPASHRDPVSAAAGGL